MYYGCWFEDQTLLLHNMNMLEQSSSADTFQLEKAGLRERCFRNIGRLAGLGAVAAGSALGGAVLLPLETNIGPHKAEVTLNFNGEVSGVVGGVGAIDKPVSLPLHLGAEIQLKEIPISSSVAGSNELLNEADLESYARLLSEYEQVVQSVREDMLARARTHGLLGAMAATVLYASYGSTRRKELWVGLTQSHGIKLAATAAILAGGIGVSTADANSHLSEPVNPIFDGTPLEGSRVRGRYMQVLVNEYGPQAVQLLRENDDFYNTAISNLSLEARRNNLLASRDKYVTIDFTTDRHCNFGMSRVIGHLASISPPDFNMDAGDFTMSGTALEEQCVAVAARYTEGDLILAAGNHDSSITETQARSHGFKVLEGEIMELEGLTILGDDDPMRSMLLSPVRQKGLESIQDVSNRLAETACKEQDPVDILLVHRSEMADEALRRGCVKTALSGHTHAFDSWRQPDSENIQIVGGSSGGVSKDTSTFGPLKAPAEIIRLQIHRKSGQLSRIQRIVIDQNANVKIHDPVYSHSLVKKTDVG